MVIESFQEIIHIALEGLIFFIHGGVIVIKVLQESSGG